MSGGGGAFGGGMVSAMGSMMEANDVDSAYQDEAKQLEHSAAITRNNADYNAKRMMIMAGKKIGTMQADYAASGVASDSGSVLDVVANSHANAELDRLNIVHAGEVKASGMERRAGQDRFSGQHAIDMGYFNAFSSIFGGAAKGSQMTASKSKASDEGED